jgi:hypothetical protein
VYTAKGKEVRAMAKDVDKIDPEDLIDSMEEDHAIETFLEEMKPRKEFIAWAEENSVDMSYEEDWLPWWKCWCSGYDRGIEDIKEILGVYSQKE